MVRGRIISYPILQSLQPVSIILTAAGHLFLGLKLIEIVGIRIYLNNLAFLMSTISPIPLGEYLPKKLKYPNI